MKMAYKPKRAIVRVLYVSAYPEDVFATLIKKGKTLSQAAQKFNTMLIHGFANRGIDVDVLYLDAFRNCKSRNEKQEDMGQTKVAFSNLGYINVRFLRRLTSIIQIERFVKKWCSLNKDGFLFADILNQYAERSIRIAHYCGVTVVAHVTDFPHYMFDENTESGRANRKAAIKSFNKKVSMVDFFVLLTEAMNETIKAPKNRYIVIEGIVPSESTEAQESADQVLSDHSSFVYTGIISRKYGLRNLVEAFMREELQEETLVLYGIGDYVEEVKRISEKYPNIQYGGYLINSEAMQKQREAKCLINPRPVGDEYTRYSFPSKNMEYMLSGRPIITTKLPGIPNEYYPYCYFFENDSVEGITRTLVEVCKISEADLCLKGYQARKYVLENKTDQIQVKRVLNMIGKEEKR